MTQTRLPYRNYKVCNVTVAVKVLWLEKKLKIKPDLHKQDITVASATGTAHLTLWQDDIGLTLLKSGPVITSNDDISNVQDESESDKNELKMPRLLVCHTSAATKHAP